MSYINSGTNLSVTALTYTMDVAVSEAKLLSVDYEFRVRKVLPKLGNCYPQFPDTVK